MPAIDLDDVLRHVDLALDGMIATVTDLGDDLVNVAPDLPGANSAYQLVRHCCGVMEYWGGAEIAGRTIERDRDAELASAGTVADLVARVDAQRARFRADLAALDPGAPALLAHRRDGYTAPVKAAVATQGGVVVHVDEELAQHRGHLDITADLARAGGARA